MTTAKAAPQTLVLRRATVKISKRDLKILFVVTALALLSIVVAGFLLIGDRVLDWKAGGRALERLASDPFKLLGSPDLILEVLIGVLGAWYLVRLLRYERLILDAAGIRYQSPMPAVLSRVQPGWNHSWAQIRSAQVGVPRFGGAHMVFVELDAVVVKRKIAGRWMPDGAAEESRPAWSWKVPSAESALRDAEQSLLVQFMRRMGVPVTVQTKAQSGFALESSPAALAVAIAAPVLLVYAAIDIAINTEIYVAQPPYELMASGGVVAFFLAAALLARTRGPRTELLGLALLFGAMSGCALYPGLLRVNQLTDSEGLRTFEYRLGNDWQWHPADPALPSLSFDGQFWSQFKPGTRKDFLLRRGGLGFYQLDLDPLNAEARAFYQRKRR